MKIEVTEGVRIGPEETLVIVPPSPMSQQAVARLSEFARAQNFKIMVLPHNCKVYIKGAKPRVDVTTIDGAVKLSGETP